MNEKSSGANRVRRPAMVTVFGILNIVWAVAVTMAALNVLAWMAPYQVTDSTLINYVKATGTFIVWIMADIATSIAGSGLLLACGLGLLLLKRWARMGAVLFGVCSIVFNVLLEVAAYISLLHPLLYSPTNPPGLDTAACIHDVLTFMAAKGVGLIYPVLLVVFMRRPKVVAACQPQRPRK